MTGFYTPWGREPIPAAETPLQLSDAVLAILHLAAAHDAVSPSKLIERLVCEHAATIGLSALVDEYERWLTERHGNSRDHSCRGGDHG